VELESHLNFNSDSRRELEPDFFFMMNCLLYSRMETGFPSNHDFYDEDVNVYIANLLCSFMNPEYHRRAKKYLSPYDTNLFKYRTHPTYVSSIPFTRPTPTSF
jgi:hypothetical protein